MKPPSEEVLDQVIGRTGLGAPFHLGEFGEPSLEAFLTDEKLAALKYRRVWAATKNAVGYLPLNAVNPWAPELLSQWVAIEKPVHGAMGAKDVRYLNHRVHSVGSRIVARLPDATPITLEWGLVEKLRFLFFPALFFGVLRAHGKSIPVREQLSMYERTAVEREGKGEFECSALAVMTPETPPLALGPIKQPQWKGWVGAYFSANESLMAEPGTPAESVWSYYFAELLVKEDLSEAIFSARYNMDASA